MSKNLVFSAVAVGMKDFMKLLTSISPEYSVCVRGRHAIGKSEGVYQAAAGMRSDFYKDPKNCAKMVEEFGGKVKTPNGWVSNWSYDLGIPVLERRLSQMTEGDIIGLPFRHGKDKFDPDTGERISSASTSFKPCDWLITSCEFPVVLFLDERNRALEGVKQAVFQLTDSKVFYGNHLHEETRVVVAENDGDDYQVQQCDPAEISRCATVTLSPSVQDWLDYATTRCHEATIEFIRNNERLLEHQENFEPNKKYPDRRSWFKLDQECQRLGLFDEPADHLLYVLACSFIGIEVGTKFAKFLKERDREVSAKDILTSWNKAKKRLAKDNTIPSEKYVECSNKLNDWTTKNKLSYEQAEQLAKFLKDAPAEVMLTVWANMQKDISNLALLHGFIEKLIMSSVNGEETKNVKIPSIEEVKSSKSGSKPKSDKVDLNQTDVGEPKKRGARQ